MLGALFTMLFLLSLYFSVLSGNEAQVGNALLTGAQDAIPFCLGIAGYEYKNRNLSTPSENQRQPRSLSLTQQNVCQKTDTGLREKTGQTYGKA